MKCEMCKRYPAKNWVETYIDRGFNMCGYCRRSIVEYYRWQYGYDGDPLDEEELKHYVVVEEVREE